MIGILVAGFVAAFFTAAITPAVRRWSEKKGVVDQPGGRRINKTPMPRTGGIAIFLGFLLATILTIAVRQLRLPSQPVWTPQVTGTLLAVCFIAFTGLIDDFYDIAAKWQALAILAAGMILIGFGVRVEGITNPFGVGVAGKYIPSQNWQSLGYGFSVVITLLWVFTVTKTVDAIDGVDGLASGVCAISAATLALMAAQLPNNTQGPTLALMAAAVAGACLGFLRHNYHPAKIIMGTIGAQVLGLALAAISIMGAFKVAAAVSVLVPVLVLGVPIFDFTHVLAQRFLAGEPLTKADNRHLHHRLRNRGWNDKQVVWFIYSVTVVFCIAALAIFHVGRGH